jgi:hypothetical protein
VHFYGEVLTPNGPVNLPVDQKGYVQYGIENYGSLEALVKHYYHLVGGLCQTRLFDTAAHFDLVKKYNKNEFDESWDDPARHYAKRHLPSDYVIPPEKKKK